MQEIVAIAKHRQIVDQSFDSGVINASEVVPAIITKFIGNKSMYSRRITSFNSAYYKLLDYTIYGNGTGDYDAEADWYKIQIVTRKQQQAIPDASVSIYPDTDGTIKASSTITLQRSIICEVEPNTAYELYINVPSSSEYYTKTMGRVAGYAQAPEVGVGPLWVDRMMMQNRPPINIFMTDDNTRYVLIYLSYGVDDITNNILPATELYKDNQVTFACESALLPSETISYKETQTSIKTNIGENVMAVNVMTPPMRMYYRYEEGDS